METAGAMTCPWSTLSPCFPLGVVNYSLHPGKKKQMTRIYQRMNIFQSGGSYLLLEDHCL